MVCNTSRTFGLVAFALNRYIVDHLLRFARQFGPDYQMLVVWGVVAHQCVTHHMPAGSRPSTVLAPDGMLKAADPELREFSRESAKRLLAVSDHIRQLLNNP
jgi:hypothetical protein